MQGRSLMGQVPVAAPDELRMHDRTQSTASQISELSEKAAEELLSKLDGVQASEVLPAKVSDSTLNGLSLGPSEAPSMAGGPPVLMVQRCSNFDMRLSNDNFQGIYDCSMPSQA